MDLNKLPVLAALMRRLDWLGERQRVLANNIANVDTPGFRPRDLAQPDFRALLAGSRDGMAMAATSAAHLGRAKSAAANAKPASAASREVDDVSPVGNGVVIEQQMMKVAETQVEHQTVANLYRKHVGLLKLALGRPQ
jgi:flagellar basal-body rod protein FlgB